MIKIQCPICHQKTSIHPTHINCINNHTFESKNGVYRLLPPKSKTDLDSYLKKFADYRSKTFNPINSNNVNELPFVKFDKHLWKLRAIDLKLILASISKKEKNISILDIGAWNGWLSHNLSKEGYNVTAMDYFTAPFDGLETVQYYTHKFLAIQAPTYDFSIFQSTFDVIIVNRCFPYFPDIPTQLTALKKILSPQGKIIITGLSIVKNPKPIINHLKKSDEIFKKEYGTSLFLVPFKGYTDKKDLSLLKDHQFMIKRYKSFFIKSLLSKIGITQVDYLYAIFDKNLSN